MEMLEVRDDLADSSDERETPTSSNEDLDINEYS